MLKMNQDASNPYARWCWITPHSAVIYRIYNLAREMAGNDGYWILRQVSAEWNCFSMNSISLPRWIAARIIWWLKIDASVVSSWTKWKSMWATRWTTRPSTYRSTYRMTRNSCGTSPLRLLFAPRWVKSAARLCGPPKASFDTPTAALNSSSANSSFEDGVEECAALNWISNSLKWFKRTTVCSTISKSAVSISVEIKPDARVSIHPTISDLINWCDQWMN